MKLGGKSLKGYSVGVDSGDSGDSTGEGAEDSRLLLPDRLASADPVSVPSGPAPTDTTPTPPPQDSGDVDLPDQKSKLEGVYAAVRNTDPDRAAKVVAIQRRINEPENFIDKNLPEVEKAMQAPSGPFFKQLEDEYPGTTQWLTDPKNMAVAQDDLHNVANHESLIQRAGNYLGTLKNAAEYGLEGSIPGMIYRQELPDQTLLPEKQDVLQRFTSSAVGFGADLPWMTLGGVLGTGAGATAGAVAGSPAGLPGIGAGVLVGGVGGGGVGGFALPAAIKAYLTQQIQNGKITSYSDILKEASKQGFLGLLTAGSGSAVKAAFPASALGAKTLTATVAPLAAEAGTLGVAGPAIEGRKPTWEDLIDSSLQIGAMHLATHSIESHLQSKQTQAALDFYTALGDTAEGSKVRARLPEAYQQMVSSLTKDGPVENVYVPVDAAESYFQSKGIDPAAAMEELGVSKSYSEAKATGGDVQVPLSTWTEKLAGTEHFQGLAPDVKFDPEDLTPRQAEAKKAEVAEQVRSLIEDRKNAESAQAAEAEKQQRLEQTSKVFQVIQDQLKAAGVSRPETEFNPQLHEAFFNTLGQHLGVEPEELAKRFPLEIGKYESANDPNIRPIPERPTDDSFDFGANAADTGAAPSESVAAQSYKPEVLKQIRDEIEAGEATKGHLTYDQDGNVTGRVGANSTFPEYFKNNGFSKEETLRAIDRHLEGKELTEKQANILNELYHSSGYDKEAKRSETVPFLQGAPKIENEPRGRIRIGREGYAIDLFRNADRSTFLHETGHYFLDVMGHIASDEGAPQQIKDDFQTILKWLGVDSKDGIGTEEHEKFARGFEKYLMEGSAPSSALTRAFNRFRKWLTSVYREAKNLNVDLSDDVRGVLDRMLASEDEISRAQREVGISEEPMQGLPPEIEAKITDLQSQARDQAENALLKEQMAETTEKRKAFLASERDRLTDQAKDQVAELPVFKASDEAVATIGKEKKAGTIAEKFLAEKLKPEEAGKFEALAEVHGFGSGEDLAHAMILAEEGKSRQREISARVEAGMAPHADLMDRDAIRGEALKAIHSEKTTELLALEREAMVQLLHRESVQAEARRRNEAEVKDERAAAEAEAAKEKDETKRAQIVEKIRQRFEARFAAEHQKEIDQEVSRRQRIEARVEAQAAKDKAREILSQKPVKESTNAQKYITAERQAAVKAAKALAKKDYPAAAEFKRQQMLNHAIAGEAMRNQREAEKSISFLSDFAKRKNDLKDMPYGFMRQIDQLLSKSGFSDPRGEDAPTLIKIAKDMAMRKEDPSEIANRTGYRQDASGNWVPEMLPDFVSRVNDNYYALSLPDSVMSGASREYKDLTLGELRELRSAVKSISDVGRKFDRFLGEYKTMDIRAAAAEFRASVEKNFGTPYAEDLLPGSRHANRLGELLSTISRTPGFFTRMLDTILTTCHKLDGLQEGPAKEFIYRPFENAESGGLARTAEAMKEMDNILGKHYEPAEFAKYKDTRFNIDGRFFTKEEILSMALNWGNEGNRQRLMDGFGFDQAKMERIFSHLGKKDWDFAQDSWDHLHKYWPDIVNLEMDVNGVEPKGVDPSAFENQHGSYRGGYYPIAYDFERSADAYKNAQSRDALYKQFSTAAAHTDQGHAQARAQAVNRPLRLSLDVLRNHHEDVIHDLEFRRAVIDVNRFLTQKDTKAALVNAIGVRGYSAITDWLKAAAGGGSEPLNGWDKAAQWFRFKTTFFNLGYRLVSAPKIAIENFVNMSSELGVSGAARAIKDYYLGESGMHELVTGKSDFMRVRAEHLNRDLADIQKKWQGTDVGSFKKFAFFVHAYLDEGVSFPLWADAYNRGIADHGDDRLAVNQADEAVKRTFMSGGRIDQAAVMRGGEKMKALTTAYGYQSMMWNRFSMQGFQASQAWSRGDHTAAAAIAARSFIYTFALPAVTAALTREILRNSQSTNDEERKKRITTTLLEETSPLKFVPILRDISPYLIKKSIGERASFQVTPLEEAASTILDVGGEALHALGGNPVSSKLPEKATNALSLVAGIPKEFNDVVFNFMDWQQNNGELAWRDFLSRRTKK